MAKYLLLKHHRGAPAAVNDVPMDQWTPEKVSAHMAYMHDFAARLYAEAAHHAPNLAERNHLMRQATRLNSQLGR
ncbi:hypothetical protein G1H10_12955 [Phytoactinopolyspora halotolerans]|uniref:Uncharacterized protein n=1 Tax=Phytoactinopolyspora halotolerans TaxID=1981512 RepID=A0A6L9S7S4_9ACTN|nr:hypothetical protein [Phytoactinopolyspora halotolerans]NEE01077.1 hypothetical protein [Phytoactinopolyspora halotolerans]